jgi:uncharacterized coiled-coil protein SlyX
MGMTMADLASVKVKIQASLDEATQAEIDTAAVIAARDATIATLQAQVTTQNNTISTLNAKLLAALAAAQKSAADAAATVTALS